MPDQVMSQRLGRAYFALPAKVVMRKKLLSPPGRVGFVTAFSWGKLDPTLSLERKYSGHTAFDHRALNFGYSDPGEVGSFCRTSRHCISKSQWSWTSVTRLPNRQSTAKTLPISELRSLSCVNVSFVPGTLDIFNACDVACGLVPESEMTVLLQFIRRLASLKNLSISGSGKAFLHYMNYMEQHFDATGAHIVPLERGWIPWLNLPKLKTLDIDMQEPNCEVLALMERRVLPGISGEDGRYYGSLLCALDICACEGAVCGTYRAAFVDVSRVEDHHA
ncbi:hypothetical protein CPB85DRAFT_1564983 [Mucidula mucida]|nr:hypothetical protein CPB85DRAFT_1564983 [Mucidula mucida]